MPSLCDVYNKSRCVVVYRLTHAKGMPLHYMIIHWVTDIQKNGSRLRHSKSHEKLFKTLFLFRLLHKLVRCGEHYVPRNAIV